MADRRQVLKAGLGGLLTLAVPHWAGARQFSTQLTSTVSLLTSAGTNVIALSTDDGLILVDTGAPDHEDQLAGELGELEGSDRVRAVFNTHYHLENSGSNATFGRLGANIIAHENARLWMSTPYWIPAEDRYEEPRPVAAQPTETFYVDGSMAAGRERIDYGYLIEAHTNGDIYVFFRDANVLAVGDVASPGRDPELDYFTGAWLGGRVDAMDRLLELSNAETQIVPTYGPVIRRPDLQIERDMMQAIYDRALDRVRQGETVTDMLEAGVLEDLAWTWADPYKFLYDVHKGLWAHHNKLAPNVV